MNKELSDQVNTIERALGECMIETASAVIRIWLNELGDNNPYEEALHSIRTKYKAMFIQWLNIDNPESEAELNKMTGDMYLLADAVYADIRLKRGLSPQMHGFNRESPQSVLTYFENCIRLTDADLQWLEEAIRDEQQTGTAIMAVTALTRNLRECFSLDAFLTLIEGMKSEEEIVAGHCVMHVLSLLIHYDVRIDFFPQLQDAFVNTVESMGDQGEHVFSMLCAMVQYSNQTLLEDYAKGAVAFKRLPEILQKLVQSTGISDTDFKTFYTMVPKEEKEYMAELVNNLPGTWLFEVLVSGNTDREKTLVKKALQCGYRDYMWAHPDVAEQFYRNVLRGGSEKAEDYINYAHCLLLKGDRMMAFENYRLARQACGSLRAFYELFRPDRRALVDGGIPLDYVYAIEDNLVNG